MAFLEDLMESVINGDQAEVERLVNQGLAGGLSAEDILQKALIPAMDEVGHLFEEGEFFMPEMLVSARAMQAGMDILRPLLAESGVEPIGRIVIGTVKGDLHDIGKNLVGMMLEGAGFEIVDLGVDVDAGKFVSAAREGADIVALSALLTTTMRGMKTVVEELEKASLRPNVKILVGGAPLTEEFARDIGADGYAPDAGQAVIAARRLLQGSILRDDATAA